MRHRLSAALAFALSCLVVAPALALERPATCATLLSVLQAAKPSDVVKVAAGDCAAINAPSASTRFRVAAPGAVVEPDGSGPVSIKGLTLNLWQGFTFRGFTINGPVVINQGQRMRVLESRIVGQEPDWTVAKAVGVRITAGSDVELSDSVITGWGQGISVAGINATFPATRITIARNTLQRIAFDGIRGFAHTDGLTIDGNTLREFAKNDLAHKDAIQGFDGPAANLTITNNVYDGSATGARRQFIFLQNRLTNVRVTNNWAFGAGPWGVAANDAQSGVIANNYVVPFEGFSARNVTPNAGAALTVEGNVEAPAVRPGDATALRAWTARFAPKPEPKTLEQRVADLEAAVAALRTR
jgi:hypothetical protein